MIWGIVAETGLPTLSDGQGFPEGFEYRWADGKSKPRRCSSTMYVENVMNWIEDLINNDIIFPTGSGIKQHSNKLYCYILYIFRNNISTYFLSNHKRYI